MVAGRVIASIFASYVRICNGTRLSGVPAAVVPRQRPKPQLGIASPFSKPQTVTAFGLHMQLDDILVVEDVVAANGLTVVDAGSPDPPT